MNPFEPKYQLFYWSTPNYAAAAGTYFPVFGLQVFPNPMAENADPRAARMIAPFDFVVREWTYTEQFSPGNPQAMTAELCIEAPIGVYTVIASVTRAANTRFARARVNRLVRKDQELSCRHIITIANAGGYSAIYTATCEQVSL